MKEENDAKANELSKNNENESRGREEVYTNIVRAGNRTYFFDVKSTRKGEYYLTITESKKRFNKEGKFFYEKHKLFLYQEDFDKFRNSLEDVFSFIDNSETGKRENIRNEDHQVEEESPDKQDSKTEESKSADEFINVEFEDLGDKE